MQTVIYACAYTFPVSECVLLCMYVASQTRQPCIKEISFHKLLFYFKLFPQVHDTFGLYISMLDSWK